MDGAVTKWHLQKQPSSWVNVRLEVQRLGQ